MGVKRREITVPSALGPASLAELVGALEQVQDGLVVLRGAGEVFCQGLDFHALRNTKTEVQRAALSDFGRCLRLLRGAPAPVVAVVEGAALGGGLGLAAASDVVIASPAARFGLPEVLFGLYPAMILAALEERMAPQKARRLALEGASIDAESALSSGLVDELTTDPERALERRLRVLSRASAGGVRALKSHPPSAERFDHAVEVGRRRTEEALTDPGVQTVIERFLAGEGTPWEEAR